MKLNKRFWRTAALAVVITALFAVFVFSVEDWTKGLSSNFVVYGQTSTGGSGGVPGVTGTNTKVIPQIAVGSFDGLTK